MSIENSTVEYKLPRSLSQRWKAEHDRRGGQAYRSRCGLIVMCSIEKRNDDNWLHVSFSRAKRIPSYDDMTLVKRLFVGDDRSAYMVFPPKSKHVNIHPYCLHFWCNLDNPQPLPEFSNTVFGVRGI